jgi:hypothetical protein
MSARGALESAASPSSHDDRVRRDLRGERAQRGTGPALEDPGLDTVDPERVDGGVDDGLTVGARPLLLHLELRG